MIYVHIYTAPGQPATRYGLDIQNRYGPDGTDPAPYVIWPPRMFWFENPPDKLLWCHACARQRRADQLIARAYFDHTSLSCRDREYGRRSTFPFEYADVCEGTAFKRKRA